MAGPLILTHTTEKQLRLRYDTTNYADFTTGSTGDLTIAPTGGDTSITGTLAVSSTVTVSAKLALKKATSIGIELQESDGTVRGQVLQTHTSGGAPGTLDLYTDSAAGTSTRVVRLRGNGQMSVTGTLDTSDTIAVKKATSGEIQFQDSSGTVRSKFVATHADGGGNAGTLDLYADNPSSVAELQTRWRNGAMLHGMTDPTGSVAKSILIGNVAAAPTVNPVGGGIMYSEAGALKWRGSAGTITTIAAA
jgi:hypothetical protein